jgi:Flp pilus assembly protein TadD
VHRLARASAKLVSRRTDGRLTQFPYVPQVPNRGLGEEERGAVVLRGMAEEIAARQVSPGNAEEQHAAGIAALLLGQYDHAIASLQRATTLAPADAVYWNDLAVALHERARRADDPRAEVIALRAVDRALPAHPDDAALLFNRAIILQALRRRGEADAAFKRYVISDSRSPWVAEAQQRQADLR